MFNGLFSRTTWVTWHQKGSGCVKSQTYQGAATKYK